MTHPPSYWTVPDIEAWLTAGNPVDALDRIGRTPLATLAERHDAPPTLVQALLAGGADPNWHRREFWAPPLIGAVRVDNAATTAALLAAGADPNAEHLGRRPLGSARSLPVLDALLAAGAVPDEEALIELAVSDKTGDLVGRLLELGVSPDARGGKDRKCALEWAIRNGKEGEAAALRLLAAGADPKGITCDGVPLVRTALAHGRVRTAAALLARGAPTKGVRGYDKLLVAVLGGDLAALDAMRGRSAPTRPKDRPFAVTVAALLGRADVLARVMVVEPPQHDTLESAIEGGDRACVALLIEAGAAKGADLLLGKLVSKARWDAADTLIAAGAPLSWAIWNLLVEGDPAVDRLLALARPRDGDRPGRYPIEQAVRRGELPRLVRLAELGVDLVSANDKGQTLADVAREAGRPDVEAWLASRGVHPREDRTAEVRARWIARLDAHRRPWPEWDRLVERAGRGDSTWFVEGGKDWLRLSETLVVRVAADATTAPDWLVALDHLGRDPRMAGGIASDASGRVPRGMIRDLFPYHGVVVPPDLRMLQTTPQGSLLCVDRADDVVGWCPSSRRFEAIGPLEPFVRFCLGCVLDGRDWYGALREGAPGLRWFDMPD